MPELKKRSGNTPVAHITAVISKKSINVPISPFHASFVLLAVAATAAASIDWLLMLPSLVFWENAIFLKPTLFPIPPINVFPYTHTHTYIYCTLTHTDSLRIAGLAARSRLHSFVPFRSCIKMCGWIPRQFIPWQWSCYTLHFIRSHSFCWYIFLKKFSCIAKYEHFLRMHIYLHGKWQPDDAFYCVLTRNRKFSRPLKVH